MLNMSHGKFHQFLNIAKQKLRAQQAEVEKTRKYINSLGGSHKPILIMAKEVCLCLFYLRRLPIFEVLGDGSELPKPRQTTYFITA
jgi:hypothetical protein